MSAGVTDAISETFPDVMRSNICNAVYDRASRRSFKFWGEWNLNGDQRVFPLAVDEDAILSAKSRNVCLRL